jgi:hypothetical protein
VATTATTSAPTATAKAFPLKYFIIAFAFTWVLWWLAVLDVRGLLSVPIPAQPLGAFGPLVAAVIVTAQESGRAGLRSLLGRILHLRCAGRGGGLARLRPSRVAGTLRRPSL